VSNFYRFVAFCEYVVVITLLLHGYFEPIINSIVLCCGDSDVYCLLFVWITVVCHCSVICVVFMLFI
jgi:hypothetical protein